MEIRLFDEEITLLPQKAIYIKKEKTLLIADIHIGKAGHFRNAGIPVPSQLAFADLKVIDGILVNSGLEIDRLMVLGDMFHAGKNTDWLIFEHWRREKDSLEIILVKGNHDILSDAHYEEMGISVVKSAVLGKFFLVHNFRHKNEHEGLYKLSGHVHPGVRFRGKGRQSMTLPCFYFNESFGILPAFGGFTGKYIIRPTGNDFVFVIAGENKVMKV